MPTLEVMAGAAMLWEVSWSFSSEKETRVTLVFSLKIILCGQSILQTSAFLLDFSTIFFGCLPAHFPGTGTWPAFLKKTHLALLEKTLIILPYSFLWSLFFTWHLEEIWSVLSSAGGGTVLHVWETVLHAQGLFYEGFLLPLYLYTQCAHSWPPDLPSWLPISGSPVLVPSGRTCLYVYTIHRTARSCYRKQREGDTFN